MKKVIIDSSSAIILFKTGQLHALLTTYHAVMTASVYRELTVNDLAGADSFRRYRQQDAIRIKNTPAPCAADDSSVPLQALDAGERDSIALYLARGGDFILLDDGRAARLCRDNGIPFINALLFPRILFCAGKLSQTAADMAAGRIMRAGRYSQPVIDFARRAGPEALLPFLP